MGRPRTNLPWIETRRRQFRAYWRTPEGKRKYAAFDNRSDAEQFRELAALVGLDNAVAFVRGELEPASGPPPEPEVLMTKGTEVEPTALAAPWSAATPMDGGWPIGAKEQSRPGNPTGVLFETLCASHLETLTGVEVKTRDDYRAKINHYLLPYFAGTDIGLVLSRPSLRAPGPQYKTVDEFLDWMAAQYTYTSTGARTDMHPMVKTRR